MSEDTVQSSKIPTFDPLIPVDQAIANLKGSSMTVLTEIHKLSRLVPGLSDSAWFRAAVSDCRFISDHINDLELDYSKISEKVLELTKNS